MPAKSFRPPSELFADMDEAEAMPQDIVDDDIPDGVLTDPVPYHPNNHEIRRLR